MKKHLNLILIALLCSSIILTACGAREPAVPTLSPEQIYTSVAATMQAGFTATALALPTNTFTPEPTQTSTSTIPPLPTIEPTDAPEPIIPPVVNQPAGFPTSTPISTNVPGDHAVLSYQYPADKSTFSVEEQVNLIWGFTNTGTSTWTTDYTLRFIGGATNLWGTKEVDIYKEVKPGKKTEFALPLRMPEEPGEYTIWWALYNGKDQKFYEVYFTVIVTR